MKTKNLQPDQKIFFLGLNKNATTTFYNFFLEMDIKLMIPQVGGVFKIKNNLETMRFLLMGMKKNLEVALTLNLTVGQIFIF